MNDLTTIRTFTYAHEAAMAQSILLEREIFAVLKDENISSIHTFYSAAGGGVKLQVKQSDVDAAVQVLLEAGYLKPADLKPGKAMAWISENMQRASGGLNKLPPFRLFQIIIFIIGLITIILLTCH